MKITNNKQIRNKLRTRVHAAKVFVVDSMGFVFLKKKKHLPKGLFETRRQEYIHIYNAVDEKGKNAAQKHTAYLTLPKDTDLDHRMDQLNEYQLAIDDYVAEFERMNSKHNELIDLEKKYRISLEDAAYVHAQVLEIEKRRHNTHYHHERYRQLLTELEINSQTFFRPPVLNVPETNHPSPVLNIHVVEDLIRKLDAFKFKIERDVYEYRELLNHEMNSIMTEFETSRLHKLEERIKKNITLFKQQIVRLEGLVATTELYQLFDKHTKHVVRQIKRFHRKVKKHDFSMQGHLDHLTHTKTIKPKYRASLKKRVARTRNKLRSKLRMLKREKK
jgi:hypothetical protein